MNRRRASAILFCVAATIGVGCAVQGSRFERVRSRPDEMVIYVYRPYSYAGSLLRPPVTCGDETVRIGPGGYHAFVVRGEDNVTCSVQGAENTDQVEIHAGSGVYYLREQLGWGVLSGHPQLIPVDSDDAWSEIKRCCVEELEVPGKPPLESRTVEGPAVGS